LRQAKLRQTACIEDIDYRHPRGLDKAKPRHDILATSGNLSRLDRAGKNPRLAVPVFPSRICPCTTSCSVF
jgi:hypothetical protein